MLVVWYQPHYVFNKRQLIHLCEDNPKTTLCGVKVNEAWISDHISERVVTCKDCLTLKERIENE